MKPRRKVEDALRKKLRFTAASTLRHRWLKDVLEAQEQSQEAQPARHEPFIGRIVMRSPVVKLTSVAAMLAVAALSMVFWSKSGSPAYAIEQTVEALQNVRFLHVLARDETGQTIDERWIEIGTNGRQVRYRQQNPPSVIAEFPRTPSMVIEDANSVAVYHQEKKAVILYGKDNQYQWIGALGEFFENLRQKGKVLKENDTYQGRRVHKVWWPAASAECYVDPQTKLPLTIGTAMLSYEEPPAGTFDIVIPDGYAVLDKRPGAVAADVPDWLQEEDKTQMNKEKAFNQGTRAVIRGDYAEAARQLEQALGYDTWAEFWLGKSYYELGQYEPAIKNFDVIFDAFKKAGAGDMIPFCQYARGLAYARLGKLDQATADFQACLPTMIRTLRTPSGGSFFEYADNPQIRNNGYKPADADMVTKMVNRLRLISGRNFGYDPNGTPEQNEAAVTAWEQWFKNGGPIQFTPDAELLFVPAEWVSRLGWGRRSNQEIASAYRSQWMNQISDSGVLLKIGFALYDAQRYEEALTVFENSEEKSAKDQKRQAMALVWQGHMLDLLGRRNEAITRYEKVAARQLESEVRHDQYGLSYKFTPYATERIQTPFTRVENTDND